MTQEKFSTLAGSLRLSIQQRLCQLIGATEADTAFLATPGARDTGGSLVIAGWYPPVAQRASLMTDWICKAVSHTLESGHTTLAAGQWRAIPEHPKRSGQLIVASVAHDDSSVHGALAIFLSSAIVDSEIIALLERYASTFRGIFTRESKLPVAPTLAWTQSAETSKRFNRVLMHELRAPLGATSYALEALAMRQADQWDSENKRLMHVAQLGLAEVQSILRSANRLRVTEGGLATPNLEAVSVEKTIARVQDLFPESRSRVHLDVEERLPLAWADEVWLRQILTNLLDNAVKYSAPRTHIKVVARPYGADRVWIAVHSLGDEFPADQRRLLARNAVDETIPGEAGQGIGLNITRSLTTAMGGEIWVESDGCGATDVIFTLPIAYT